MFTLEQDEILKQLLLNIPNLIPVAQTPFKKHILPDYLKQQLYGRLTDEYTDWPQTAVETKRLSMLIRRIGALNREEYQPSSVFGRAKPAKKNTSSLTRRLFAVRHEVEEDDKSGSRILMSPIGTGDLETPIKTRSGRRKSGLALKPASNIDSPSPARKIVLPILATPTKVTKRAKIVVPTFDKTNQNRKNDSDVGFDYPKLIRTPNTRSKVEHDSPSVVPNGDPFLSPIKYEGVVPNILIKTKRKPHTNSADASSIKLRLRKSPRFSV